MKLKEALDQKRFVVTSEIQAPLGPFVHCMNAIQEIIRALKGADFFKVVQEIGRAFDIKASPMFLSIGAEDKFEGVVDLIKDVKKSDISCVWRLIFLGESCDTKTR